LLLPCQSWSRGGCRALDWKAHAHHVDTHFGPEGADGDNMLRVQHAPVFAELFNRACREAEV
jgi:hypothetical protein